MATVLIVEDRLRERNYLVTLLQYGGHSVLEAADGGDAVALTHNGVPDLVITDLFMPTMDGFEFIRQLRDRPETRNMPVILYTAAYDESATRDLVSQCAGTTLIPKPADPELLLETVNHLLGEAPRQLSALGQDFTSAHLQLVTTKLHEQMTALELANLEIAQKESLLRLVTNAVPVLISFIDTEQRFQFSNQAHERWFGQSPEEIRSKSLEEVFGRQAYVAIREYAEKALSGEAVSFERQLDFGAGIEKYIRATFIPERNREQEISGFVGLVEDLSELRNIELTLREMNAALQRSNEALRQFAFAAAHDLREPSRQTALYAQLIAETFKEKLGPEGEELVKYCSAGANRMASLVADMLKMTELTEGFGAPAGILSIDANEILNRTLEDLQLRIRESGARITCGELPRLRVAPVHLSQIFLNLIGNAIKFRHPERALEIAVTATDGRISISDNGIGIAPEYHAKIFSLFQRLHGQHYSGTGMGLTLCQKVIELYGGRIWLESELGKGSVFHFTLPTGANRSTSVLKEGSMCPVS